MPAPRACLHAADTSFGGSMSRSRFVAIALALGLGGLAACQRQGDSSLFAADAHAATLAAPPAANAPAADANRVLGPMPSLSPLVKQLRPVVLNISTPVKAK